MQGRFDYNDIHSNKLAGVWIKNYASTVFRKNKVHHGKDVGFFVFQDGQVRERKEGRERESVWERYMEGGRERERKRERGKERRAALFISISLSLQGVLEENDIHRNRIAGIEIKNDANPIITRCLIHHGSTGGVYVHDKVC